MADRATQPAPTNVELTSAYWIALASDVELPPPGFVSAMEKLLGTILTEPLPRLGSPREVLADFANSEGGLDMGINTNGDSKKRPLRMPKIDTARSGAGAT